jgi:hypothetical protein
MAKVIEFYVRDLTPKKVKWVPCDQRGKVIEFPKEKSVQSTGTDQVRDLYKAGSGAVSSPACFQPTA